MADIAGPLGGETAWAIENAMVKIPVFIAYRVLCSLGAIYKN